MPPNEKQGGLLAAIIDEKARMLSDDTFMRYPLKDWATEGYKTMTWRQYGDSINKTAHWLDENFGKSTNNDTIAYLGPNDPRYSILLPAMIKTGRKLFIPDGRVTSEGLQNLNTAMQCNVWICAGDEAVKTGTGIAPGLKVHAAPSLEWFLNSEGFKHYPYMKTFEETKDDIILAIHTCQRHYTCTGTTGLPKPIYHTNGFHACSSAIDQLSRNHWPRGVVYDTWVAKKVLSPCPPQWLAGIHVQILGPVYCEVSNLNRYTSSIILPPDVTGMPPALFKKLLVMSLVDGIICPPHTIVELYKDIETQPLLRSLKFIVYLGAQLDQAIGDDLCEHTKLTSIIGSTETGTQIDLMPLDKKLWHTHDFVPDGGATYERVEGSGLGDDDLYELVLTRPKGADPNLYQSAFWNPMYKDLDRIETKEMYAPVKDRDGRTRWIFNARKDDLTKLSWLAKFHAQDIETRIESHLDVSKVFVGGEGRPTPFVIIQPREGVIERKSAEGLLDELYSGVIAHSSRNSVGEITIPKETVMIAKEGKPFKLNAKQLILRSQAQVDYAEEIEAAYARLKKVTGTA